MMTALWTAVLMLALLWPAHTLPVVHGVPLDTRTGAVLLGLVFPVLAWLRPRFLANAGARAAIIALLVLKAGDATLLTQQGLCARFSTAAPYGANVLTIPIEEPSGVLRSWDVRADWRAAAPGCTAIVDRPYPLASAFPAWFTNITRFDARAATPVMLDISGYVRVKERGLFAIETSDRPLLKALEPGVQPVSMHIRLQGDHWWLAPTFNGRDAFSAASLTTQPPRAADRLAGVFAASETAIVLLLAACWIMSIALDYRDSPALVAWCVLSAAVFATVGMTGRFERLSVLLLAAAVMVPVSASHRNVRAAFLMLGVPWLALIVARALPQVGHFTTYSNDDWLAYQVAGYRIFMSGFWLEGGSKVFDYQPLYRWITGALHIFFGDSSVGETMWDAVCLWLGAAVSFSVVNRAAGFRWGLAAAVGTLATFWLGTIWYFVGRGLSEVSAAGFGFVAALLLLRNDRGSVFLAVIAGICAALMFYTRLNQLIFGGVLLALLATFELRAAIAYVTTYAAAVALFAARTWWYTGVFSIVYGTSLKNNDTGLRFSTVGEPAVWIRIWHSLRALAWMNEPPSFDPRAVLVVAGLLLSVIAIPLATKLSRPVVGLAIVTLGACASSLLAHTHNYPGRMSIHLVPFAVAMTAIAASKLPVRV